MRLGIVSDVHCNAAALTAAIRRLSTEVDDIIVAGDAVLQYRFSNEVVEIIRREARGYVLGNHELALLDTGTEEFQVHRFRDPALPMPAALTAR